MIPIRTPKGEFRAWTQRVGNNLTIQGFQLKPPRGAVLHTARLAESDVEERAGFLLTTPLRDLLDAAASDGVPQDELTKSTCIALERGLVRCRALEQSARHARGKERLARALAPTRRRPR